VFSKPFFESLIRGPSVEAQREIIHPPGITSRLPTTHSQPIHTASSTWFANQMLADWSTASWDKTGRVLRVVTLSEILTATAGQRSVPRANENRDWDQRD